MSQITFVRSIANGGCASMTPPPETKAAALLKTSQSRLARMEAGDPSVSLDLLVRGLFALGVSPRDLLKAA